MLMRLKRLGERLLAEVDLRDAFVFGGIGLVGYGAGLIYMPAGFIVVGSAIFWLGVRK